MVLNIILFDLKWLGFQRNIIIVNILSLYLFEYGVFRSFLVPLPFFANISCCEGIHCIRCSFDRLRRHDSPSITKIWHCQKKKRYQSHSGFELFYILALILIVDTYPQLILTHPLGLSENWVPYLDFNHL